MSGAGSAGAPVVVCFPFVGKELGGSHISACGLIRHLDHNRYIPRVVLQYADSPIGELFSDYGIAVEPSPQTAALRLTQPFGIDHAINALASIQPLTHFLRERDVRIVHSNDGRTHATWALPARLAGAKLLWHHRSGPTASGLRFAAPLLADKVVSVSAYAAPRPGLYSAAHKTQVIHSPFDVNVEEDRDDARKALLAELQCPPQTRFIGFFGALIDRKRPLLFVDAIAALRQQAPDIPVMGLVFGEHFFDSAARLSARIAAHGMADHIKLMGFRKPGSRWLAACDALMVTAVDEPFGRTLIEAMLVGTPVVATNSGGNPEALRDGVTGLLVPAEDAQGLAAACARLLHSPELGRAITDRACAEAKEKFGEDCHAAAVMSLYDELLSLGPKKTMRKKANATYHQSVEDGHA